MSNNKWYPADVAIVMLVSVFPIAFIGLMVALIIGAAQGCA